MNKYEVTQQPLTPYRVLDLTEGGYNWCGKVLGDLGADVIKIEPPGGSPTRKRGPFVNDEPHLEHSLYWYAYCANKRGVTLDIESASGRGQFLKLVSTADYLIESFEPGYMDNLGLGYRHLSEINPGLIMTSITPFGQTGPYAHYRATDMVSWSMGGMQYLAGDPDRPPVRIGYPQAELHAGAQAAAGSMIAFWHRQVTGEGQHVDASAQTAVVWTLMNATPFPQLHKVNLERAGSLHVSRVGDLRLRAVFPCKDGFVTYMFGAGLGARLSIDPVVKWMREEDFAPEWVADTDWSRLGFIEAASEGPHATKQIQDLHDLIEAFYTTKTKAELYDAAIERGVLLAPCQTMEDITKDIQLEDRGYWVNLMHPELGESISYPGPFIKMGESPIAIRRRAPLLGEHNDEVFAELADAPAVAAARGSAVPTSDVGRLPFEGLKVLDFTWVGVGPTTIKYLADHGANVVRVESLTRPDVLRSAPPFKDAEPGVNRSQFPANFNTSKYGLGLNLSKPEAVELIRRIVADWEPDIIAESFTPRVMAGWGLDYESIKEIKPDIIYFSTCQQGQTGPRARYRGFGQLAASLAGYYHITGWPDREPSAPYGAYSDFINPPNALAALVGALEYRRRTGKGQHLDLAQYECALQYLGPELLDYRVNGRTVERRGNRDAEHAPHGVYRCADEVREITGLGESWIAIAVSNDTEWQAMCSLIGGPEIAGDPRFETFDARCEHADDLDAIISEWTKDRTAHEAMKTLQEAGVPAGAVQSQADLWEDPQLKHRDFFQWLNHTECGPMPYDGLQFLLSKTPGRLRMPHALIGEHNEVVLKEFVGLSDDEIADLIVAEVLETS